jgi:hypothetical protein
MHSLPHPNGIAVGSLDEAIELAAAAARRS